MLDQYPKKRPSLPPEYQRIYDKHFLENREGCSRASSVTRKIESWMHRKIAADIVGHILSQEIPTLEIGGGTLNHLKYEKNIRPYDIVEPNRKLYSRSEWLKNIRNAFDNIFDVPDERKYRRIISIATLEHLTNLPQIIAKAGVLLEEYGCLRVGIPNEGSWLWRLGYTLTTGLEFRMRYHLDYRVIMSYEHVNTADEIEEVLNFFFNSVKCQVCGFNKNVAFYRYYECSIPNLQKCSLFFFRQG